MDLQLSDKTALVTVASMGTGRAIGKGLALEDVRVAAVARRVELMAAKPTRSWRRAVRAPC